MLPCQVIHRCSGSTFHTSVTTHTSNISIINQYFDRLPYQYQPPPPSAPFLPKSTITNGQQAASRQISDMQAFVHQLLPTVRRRNARPVDHSPQSYCWVKEGHLPAYPAGLFLPPIIQPRPLPGPRACLPLSQRCSAAARVMWQ